MSNCMAQADHDRYSRDCRLIPIPNNTACARARMRVCPPEVRPPTIEEGKSGINLLGVYIVCKKKPTLLAPYPPSRPMPHEAAAQVALDRLTTQSVQQSAEVLKLKSRASAARKIELSLGFWLGLGLVGVGGVALYLRR